MYSTAKGGVDNGFDVTKVFSPTRLSNTLKEHKESKVANSSTASFKRMLEQARLAHTKRRKPHWQVSLLAADRVANPKSKTSARPVRKIFSPPLYDAEQSPILKTEFGIKDSPVESDKGEEEKENVGNDVDLCIENEYPQQELHTPNVESNVTTRKSNRTQTTTVSLRDPNSVWGSKSKSGAKMSKHDYTFAPGEAATIGGKAMPGRTYHTNAIDTSYNVDTAYQKQLQDVATSMAALCNIGNSCYMNSVIYTLRYTPLFLHNLHHLVSDFAPIFSQKENQLKMKSASLGRNVNGLQGQNARSYSSKDLVSLGSSSSSTVSLPALELAKTTQQKASEKLHELFQCLSNNENTETTEPYQSDIFLKAIQEVNPLFEGNQQQDAHEFLMCILDSIRETCQSLKKIVTDNRELIFQGYKCAVDQVDIVKPIVSPPPQIPEKKSSSIFSFKRRGTDKHKTMPVESPSKESRSSAENAATANATALTAAASTSTSPVVNGVAGAETTPASDESILEKVRELGIDFFSDDFEGTTLWTTRCLSCETTTKNKETMLDLSVPISENMETHESDEFFIQNLCLTRERFQGDNKFHCEKCIGYTEAIRQISYPKLPRVLVIQLKRFSGGMEKINSYIPTPFTLQCFCADCCANVDGPKAHAYKLYSVITHVGATMCAGHYIAYTCSLNLNSCYSNCAKEAYKNAQAAALAAAAAESAVAITANAVSGSGSTSASGKDNGKSNHSLTAVTPLGVVKKLISRGKTDSSKHQKNANGSVKGITNGVETLQLINNASTTSSTSTSNTTSTTTTCPSINCCSIKMKTMPKASNSATTVNGNGSNNSASAGTGITMTNGDYTANHSRNGSLSSVYSEHDQFGHVNGVNGGGASSTTNSAIVNAEPIWFQCDDDKIIAMPQHEFREKLLPNKKNPITPYLLFYARNDVFKSSH